MPIQMHENIPAPGEEEEEEYEGMGWLCYVCPTDRRVNFSPGKKPTRVLPADFQVPTGWPAGGKWSGQLGHPVGR